MNLQSFVLISVLFNAFLFIGQLGFVDIANQTGDVGTSLDSIENAQVQDFIVNDTLQAGRDGYTDALSSARNSTVETEGGSFTDLFSTMLNWVLNSVGLSYIIDALTALPNFLSFVFGLVGLNLIGSVLGYIWHILTLFALISWVRG